MVAYRETMKVVILMNQCVVVEWLRAVVVEVVGTIERRLDPCPAGTRVGG
jgi:hypothetical protein